jgi:predicted transcriptional regulator
MKAILMSIQSKWLAKILDGEKTIELRKRFPKDYRGWVYAYCTSNIGNDVNGKVVCRFWVGNVEEIDTNLGHPSIYVKACVQDQEAIEYGKGKTVKAIHISKLEIFDKPKELGEFSVERYAEMPNGVFPCYEPIIKAPQSWQYIYITEEVL